MLVCCEDTNRPVSAQLCGNLGCCEDLNVRWWIGIFLGEQEEHTRSEGLCDDVQGLCSHTRSDHAHLLECQYRICGGDAASNHFDRLIGDSKTGSRVE